VHNKRFSGFLIDQNSVSKEMLHMLHLQLVLNIELSIQLDLCISPTPHQYGYPAKVQLQFINSTTGKP
jgi:hypothetical protein